MSINYSLSSRPVTGHKEETRVYATAQVGLVMDINQFADHIASHGSVYSRDVIAGVLMKAVDCMQEKLVEWYKIQLGELGAFYVSLNNLNWMKLPELMEEYRPNVHVRSLTVNWVRGEKMRNLLPKAEFNLVANRKAQAALLAAVRKGETSVDLNNPSTGIGGSSSGGGGSSSDVDPDNPLG